MNAAWRPEYSIGIADVDDQHKHLLGLLGRVGVLAAGVVDGRELAKVFGELQEYAAYHFSSEEHLVHAAMLPMAHAQQHLSAHRQYWRAVAQLEERLGAGDHSAAPALYKFLQHWWLDHICRVDRELGDLILASTKDW